MEMRREPVIHFDHPESQLRPPLPLFLSVLSGDNEPHNLVLSFLVPLMGIFPLVAGADRALVFQPESERYSRWIHQSVGMLRIMAAEMKNWNA